MIPEQRKQYYNSYSSNDYNNVIYIIMARPVPLGDYSYTTTEPGSNYSE